MIFDILKDSVSTFLSYLTFLGDITIAAILILGIYVYFTKEKEHRNVIGFWKFLGKNALLFAFIVALVSMSGSLFFSEVLGYAPCKLCWFQRIFMYPLVLILGIALFKRERKIFRYVIPMSVIGGLIAAYHYISQVLEYTGTCGANSEVPCAIKYTFELGYITIPMMALTAFVLICILGYMNRKR